VGELFERVVASDPAAFTGERLTGAVGGQLEAEHHHRYLLARHLSRGRDVVDVAAGEGYGTAMLAQVARSAIGCDLDPAAMLAARLAFRRSNLCFLAADARALPFAAASADIVVCFEALEHFVEQEIFLREARRVLRAGGLLLLSTPDRDIYSPIGSAPNPFHRRELTSTELLSMVGGCFPHVALARQRPMVGSVLLPERTTAAPLVFERRGDSHYEAGLDLPRAPYLICLASDDILPEPPVSLLILHSDVDAGARLDTARHAAVQGEAAALAEVDRLSHAARVLEAGHSDVQRDLQRAEAETARVSAALAASQSDARSLSDACLAAYSELASRTAEREEARAEAVVLSKERDQARDHAASRVQQCDAALRQIGEQADERDKALQQAQESRAELRLVAERLARASMQVAEERRAAEHAQMEIQRLDAAAATTRLRELATEDRLSAIERSTTWTATACLRRVGSRHPRFARRVRLALLLAMWARHGELRTRFLMWWAVRTRSLPVAALSPGPETRALREGFTTPTRTAPEISVIIPSFGQVAVTLRCLVALCAATTRASLEVLVADDASNDPDLQRLDDIPGLRLLRNPRNVGFLRNCNAAVTHARGRFLLFLNNDTEVQPGAVDALLMLALARPDAGAVGARLIYPDGSLQEAGGIIWADGSGWNYGHRGDPAAPEFNYVREVDYCSAAALLVPRALFAEMGGFDERYAPAYCEDSDLAFRIRERGLKVLYQPLAVVVHHEGLSHGTDTGAGIKAYQVANQQTLRQRWTDVLRREHFPSGTEVLRARDRARGRTVCLVIDHYVPEPDRDAGSGTMIGFIRTLQEAGWVVKFWPDNQAPTQPYTDALRQSGVEVICGPPRVSFARWIATNGASLDHVLLSRPTVAPNYLPGLARHARRAALTFYGHDLHAVRMRREAALDDDAAMLGRANLMEKTERLVWRQVDAVLYPSETEVEAVCTLEPSVTACAVTPYRYAVPPARHTPAPGRDLLFVAGFGHPPNLDAAVWLVREIMPLIRASVADVRLALVGSYPTAEVLALAGAGVEVTGYVPDAELLRRYMSARVAIVPLRVGAGVKAKVAEALRAGLPLVTTTIGAEGMPGVATVAAVADEPATIAAEVARLLCDDAAWLAASQAQTGYAAMHFGSERMRETLLAAMAAAACVRAARSAPIAGEAAG
jgi:GT2 family glycosyltransferase/SAM-dependent methyltransferase/glycosyltransferase involved in cell wall biosynthesis